MRYISLETKCTFKLVLSVELPSEADTFNYYYFIINISTHLSNARDCILRTCRVDIESRRACWSVYIVYVMTEFWVASRYIVYIYAIESKSNSKIWYWINKTIKKWWLWCTIAKISVQSVNNKQKCWSVIMDSVLKLKRHNEIIIINVTVVESETERKKGGGCTSKVASLHHLTILHFNSIIYFKFIWLRWFLFL